MIKVTRLNGKKYWLNPHLIEFMEETPDTVVSLISGKKVVIKEQVEEVLARIIAYRRRLGEAGQEWVSTENRGEQ
ncbi:MAG: flagellar FlbD family protein [Firmicutes bacterium]|jgi:flagellar protein FlbD|nr:flagellar FlbD family protein [Bacillota bacterium]